MYKESTSTSWTEIAVLNYDVELPQGVDKRGKNVTYDMMVKLDGYNETVSKEVKTLCTCKNFRFIKGGKFVFVTVLIIIIVTRSRPITNIKSKFWEKYSDTDMKLLFKNK